MGKMKALAMDFEEQLFDLVNIEEIINECEDFGQFSHKLMMAPGVLAWWTDVGTHNGRYIVSNIWNEYWGAYV